MGGLRALRGTALALWLWAGFAAMGAVAAQESEEEGSVSSAASGNADLPKVAIHTSAGSMTIELWPHKAPRTVENFLQLVDDGFYAGTIFHRVIAGFVIQAGGYDAEMAYREPPRKVVNESHNGERNLRWTVAMARHADPNSAGSQFFVNMADSAHLDAQPGVPGYTVFGALVAGRDVAEQIELAETGTDGVPLAPIAILALERVDTR